MRCLRSGKSSRWWALRATPSPVGSASGSSLSSCDTVRVSQGGHAVEATDSRQGGFPSAGAMQLPGPLAHCVLSAGQAAAAWEQCLSAHQDAACSRTSATSVCMHTSMRIQRGASGSPALPIGSSTDTSETSTCGTTQGINRTHERTRGITGKAAGIAPGPSHLAPGRTQDPQADPSAKGPPRDDITWGDRHCGARPTAKQRGTEGSGFPPPCCLLIGCESIPWRRRSLGMTSHGGTVIASARPTAKQRGSEGSGFPPPCCLLIGREPIPWRGSRLGIRSRGSLSPRAPAPQQSGRDVKNLAPATILQPHWPRVGVLHTLPGARQNPFPAFSLRPAPCSAHRRRRPPRAGAAHGLRQIPASHQPRDYAHMRRIPRGCA